MILLCNINSIGIVVKHDLINSIGIAATGVMDNDNRIITDNRLLDYSNISASTTTSGNPLLARCVTGLDPNDGDDNNVLGGLYFNGILIPNGPCNSSPVQPQGAVINNFVGVINLVQCGGFSPEGEGIYTCSMMNSSMMYQSTSFGIYFTGRSESNVQSLRPLLCMHVCTLFCT